MVVSPDNKGVVEKNHAKENHGAWNTSFVTHRLAIFLN